MQPYTIGYVGEASSKRKEQKKFYIRKIAQEFSGRVPVITYTDYSYLDKGFRICVNELKSNG